MNWQNEVSTATEIAREAGGVVLSYFGTQRVSPRAKGERDVVTAADTASEELVLRRLRERFPGDGIVAEEGGSEAGTGTRRWYVDPLDGTVNYSRGLPIWCVSLALFDGDQPVLGVVHDPIRDETFTAASGHGAWLGNVSLHGSSIAEFANALVHITVDFNELSLWTGLEDIQALAPHVMRTRNTGSAALALAYVAAGRFDVMVHRHAHTWDYGAGVLLIREAGGSVTDITGEPYSSDTVALVAASTASLHSSVIQLLKSSNRTSVE